MSFGEIFLWSEATPVLLAVPVAWLALLWIDASRARKLSAVLGPRQKVLAREFDDTRRRARRRLTVVGVLFLLLAVLQPMWGMAERKVEQRGIDLVLCLDVSRSMLARDLAPDRLTFAKQRIRALCMEADTDRFGLVVFAGNAKLAVPLTKDRGSFADLVDLQNPTSVTRGGTDLGTALDTALDALQGEEGKHQAVLLVTDGEDHEQRGLMAARRCSERNVVVHCMGLGSSLGTKIAIGGPAGEAFLRDSAGKEVITRLDVDGLRRIAQATGGVFVQAKADDEPLVDLYRNQVQSIARKVLATTQQRERANRFQWPLLLAFVIFLIELGMNERRRP